MAIHYLNRAQLEDRAGLRRGAAARMKLPPYDVTIGPINEDGTLPPGTVRGWSTETADEWIATRPTRRKVAM